MSKDIKNIVFDFGGVIITGDDEGIVYNSEKVMSFLSVSQDMLIKAWGRAWPDYKVGKISENELFEIFLQVCQLEPSQEKIDFLKNEYREHVDKLPAFWVPQELQKNYPLYALTNIGKEWLDYKIKKFSLDQMFKVVVSSPEEGVAKPNEEIYKRLITKTQIDPTESVFVDDLEPNIKTASELGFKTIWFKNETQLITELNKLGVKINE